MDKDLRSLYGRSPKAGERCPFRGKRCWHRLGLGGWRLNLRVKADVLDQEGPALRGVSLRDEAAVQEKAPGLLLPGLKDGQGFPTLGAGVLHGLPDQLDAEAPLPAA